jgi:hypothetical protein
MQIKTFALFLVVCATVGACSKKNVPVAENKNVATAKKQAPVKPVVKSYVPKLITVDGRAAKKSPDGRLYYDFEGHRYWRNYVNGKYYLYNKSMYMDPAFRPQ